MSAYRREGGQRRTISGAPVNGTATPNSIDGVVDNRGFTGHEMLDQLDLVHMNGRVYEPFLGRFLSADPLVQDPMNGQSYNRYSYVLNNPTNLTDPTGFSPACTGSHIEGPCGANVRLAEGYPQNQDSKSTGAAPSQFDRDFASRFFTPPPAPKSNVVNGSEKATAKEAGDVSGIGMKMVHGALTVASFIPTLPGAAASAIEALFICFKETTWMRAWHSRRRALVL